MALSISGTIQAQPAPAPVQAPPVTQQPPQQQLVADTVTLSQSAQVIQLNQQGQIPSQIAANLGIPVSTVNSDLGIAAQAPTGALTKSASAA